LREPRKPVSAGTAEQLQETVMDDETFKIEVLSRLDQIIELLQSALPEASLEEPEAEQGKAEGPVYSLNDEMQDAMQRWQQESSN